MGTEDYVLENFFGKKQYFADAVNGLLFQGRQILKPENLEQLQNVYKTTGAKGTNIRRRDVVMRTAWGTAMLS